MVLVKKVKLTKESLEGEKNLCQAWVLANSLKLGSRFYSGKILVYGWISVPIII